MNKHRSNNPRCDGYTVFSVPAGDALPGQHATLIDMNGEIIHEWSITGTPAMMLPGGSLLGSSTSSREAKSEQRLGTIALVQESWDGQEEWYFSNWDDAGTGIMMCRLHHDYQRENNPVGYYAPGQDFIEQGKTIILGNKNKVIPEIRGDNEIVDDVIYEVDWNGNLTGFEWHAADHYDEFEFDDSAKEDIYKSGESGGAVRGRGGDPRDWLHTNSMALLGENHWYDETGDERFKPENIIIGSRRASFIAIISRSTGHIVWRIGPDYSESTPEHNIGQIIGQHHVHMIPKGLPGEGNILVFDNGGRSGYGGPTGSPRYTREYSRVVEFNPVTLEIVWQYGTESGEEQFYSSFISSAQRLPNGNTLITAGANGQIFEVTHNKDIVWEYVSQSIGTMGNTVYRAYRVPPEWVPGNPAGYAEWATLYL